MRRLALIPATPVLLSHIDRTEPRRSLAARAAILDVLAIASAWALPVDTLPVLLGLGGFGIDRGIDTRTGDLLEADAWVDAVTALDEDERDACRTAHPGLAIAALHAHEVGVTIGAAGTSEDMLAPIDLSGAASADAPLAPVPGASDFDADVAAAIARWDTPTLRTAVSGARAVHADLDLLGAALDHPEVGTPGTREVTIVHDSTVHDVRTLCAVAEG
ncbi:MULTISPECIES: hypothetical protein [unclassified Brevibacterium]|uniref:hypothetical protein n=1 Tax=unclassified Brevibacterium TaxID=2614124 RepID=UPI001BA577F5|nr:hypothetical protein [Brevibacterium sp. W7.2]